MLRYIELKTGFSDNGPAWIAQVEISRSGRTVYFNGKALKRAMGGGISGNHYDLATGQEYWISGIKKNGFDRHWAGSGRIAIEESVVAEYLHAVGSSKLDENRFEIIHDLEPTDPSKFFALENKKLRPGDTGSTTA